MPNRRFILTSLVVACILGAGIAISGAFEEPLERFLVVGAAALFALAVIRTNLLRPYLVVRAWRAYATLHGHRAVVGRHGEPRMVGERNGVHFVMAQSTSLLSGGGGYYARTTVTASIDNGVPDGLRLYRRDALEWMHQLSGLRHVETGDAELDKRLMIEGSDATESTEWVARNRSALLELLDEYPRAIVYGSEVDGLPASAGGASGAVTIIVVGRKSKQRDLDEFIGTACDYASLLDAP